MLLLGRELPKDANPFEAKKQLAFEIVQTYYSPEIAKKTLDEWNARFSEKRLDEAELSTVDAKVLASGVEATGAVGGVVIAYQEGFGIKKSRADASRLMKQGSVQLDGKKIVDPKTKISLKSGQVLRLDKTHAVRIK